jgi:CDGSH-type Zn-finger protein
MEEKKIATKFTIQPNGPIHVTGKFVITGKGGKVFEHEGDVYLCRCGGTNNAPFCDGTHKTIGVRD